MLIILIQAEAPKEKEEEPVKTKGNQMQKNKKEDLAIIIKFQLPIKKKHLSEERVKELAQILLQLQAASKPRINATPFRPLSSNLPFPYRRIAAS